MRSMTGRMARTLVSDPTGWIVLAYLLAAAGVWTGLWGQEWSAITGSAYESPSGQHWLGTNRLGQDIFQRLVSGSAVAFEVGLTVALATTVFGGLLGAVAGYLENRRIDAVVLWLAGTIDAIPFYLFVAAFAFALQGQPGAIPAAMVLTFWTMTARLVRAETRRLRALPFVDAARVGGLRPSRIVVRHILPNTGHLLVVQASIVFVAAIKAEVVLSFLGIGDRDGVSWGTMLAEAGQEILAGRYMNFLAASAALFVLVVAVNRLAEAVQRDLQPNVWNRPDATPASVRRLPSS